MIEDVEFGTGEVQFIAVQACGASHSVHVERSPYEFLLIRGSLRQRGDAPEHRVNARRQDLRAERFGDVIVGAEFQADHDVAFLAFRGQHDDGNPPRGRIVLEVPADRQTVHAGQHQIQQDQIRLVGDGVLQCGLSVLAADGNQKSLPQQIVADQFLDGLLVLHDHDSFSAHDIPFQVFNAVFSFQ